MSENDLTARARALLARTDGHTPGPWSHDPSGGGIETRGGRKRIGTVPTRLDGLPSNEDAANALAIAALPELRSLLAEFVEASSC